VFAIVLILVPLVAVVGWAFFRLTPVHADRRTVLRFNVGTLALSAMLAVVWCVRTYVVMSPTEDSGWWPVISVLGAVVIITLVLALAAILRTVVVSRRGAGDVNE